MPKNLVKHHEPNKAGSEMRDIILGWQDGLVNVLGVILAVAAATSDAKTVIIAGLAATFAESISMAAVAYTSTKAERDYYSKEEQRELREIEDMPEAERKEVFDIYYKKGFRGNLLNQIVKKITSNKKVWLNIMMSEELGLSKNHNHPGKAALVVGIAALIGSLFPLLPFFLFSVQAAILPTLIICVSVLFALGATKAKLTTGNWIKEGVEIAVIGLAAALVGYGIGVALGVAIG